MPEVSVATRHVMQANRSEDTGPELVVRRWLRTAGLPGYRLHWKRAPGRPDVCYPGRKVAIFVNGCYWHRCPHCDLPLPKTRRDFWQAKFERNRARDERCERELVEDGWTVLVVWECALRKGRVRATMRDVELEVERAADGSRRVARVVDAGRAAFMRLALARRRPRPLPRARRGTRRPLACGRPVGCARPTAALGARCARAGRGR